MLHIYVAADIRDESPVALNRSIHGMEISLVGHTSTPPHLNGMRMSAGDLEVALSQTAWVMVDYPAHEHVGRPVPHARLKVSREFLGP